MPLFDAILESRNFTEKKVQKIVRKLFSAISYLHDHNIAHRDLKPENIIFDRMEEDAQPKLLDFGAAFKYDEGVTYAVINEEAGTLGYKSPEMITGSPCSLKVDCWSMGVISYIMLCGFPPFFSDPTDKDNDDQLVNAPFWFFFNSVSKDLKDQILTASYSFPEKFWSEISAEAKDFVSSLLQVDPEVRLSAKQALHHKWHGVPELLLPTARVLSTQAVLQKRLTSTNLLLEKEGRRVELVDAPANDLASNRRLTLRAAQRKWTSGLVDTVSFAVPGGIQDFSDSTKYFRKTPRHPRLHVNQISFQPPDPRKIDGKSKLSQSVPQGDDMDCQDPRKIKRDTHMLDEEKEEGEPSSSAKKEKRPRRKSRKEHTGKEGSDESKSSSSAASKDGPPGSASPRLKVVSNQHQKKQEISSGTKSQPNAAKNETVSNSAEKGVLHAELMARFEDKSEEEKEGGEKKGKKQEAENTEDVMKREKKKKGLISSPFKKRN